VLLRRSGMRFAPSGAGTGLVSLKRLTILMAGWEYPPFHTGGLGVHCYEISRELARLGHRVVFLTPFPGPFADAPGVEFRTLSECLPPGTSIPGAYTPAEIYGPHFLDVVNQYNDWIAHLTDVDDVDIVHVHDWFGTVGCRALARRLGIPLVMSVHSTEYDRTLGHPYASILERERIGIRAADRIIAVSRQLGEQLVTLYDAPPPRVRVVYNAVRPVAPELDEGLPRDVVLYLGRLTRMKGPDTFLRAAAIVAPAFPEIRFAVAGEGPEYEHLIALAASLDIGDRVLFFGKVTEPERAALLRDAAVFVLPSVVEPFGIAALEAMAAGVPTIVSKTSGVGEVVRSAFQVDFWDVDEFASRISELLEYPHLSREMSEQARYEATEAGWAERARQTIDVYREAIRARALHR